MISMPVSSSFALCKFLSVLMQAVLFFPIMLYAGSFRVFVLLSVIFVFTHHYCLLFVVLFDL